MLTRQLIHTIPRASRQHVALGATRTWSDWRETGGSVKEFIQDMTSRPPTVSTDVIDAGRALQLLRTLPTRQTDVAAGTAPAVLGGSLEKAHHLIYFQPQDWMRELAEDGTSTEYNAPAPYKRRMWAGGAFEWFPDRGLPIGKEVTQTITVPDVSEKSGMMFVNQVREYQATDAPKGEWAVREHRTHVFLPDEAAQTKPKPKPSTVGMPKPDYTFTYTPSTPLLFRYSALTFNAHKIHYDIEWTLKKEGHPDLVVHGPLTATLLVELGAEAALDTATNFTRFDYRATSPMYVDRDITLNAAWDTRGEKLTLWAEQDDKVGMKATAVFAPAVL